MARLGSKYPVLFGATLLAFSAAFYGRRRLFPEVFEEQERKKAEGFRRAKEFRDTVAEGIRGEKEKRP